MQSECIKGYHRFIIGFYSILKCLRSLFKELPWVSRQGFPIPNFFSKVLLRNLPGISLEFHQGFFKIYFFNLFRDGRGSSRNFSWNFSEDSLRNFTKSHFEDISRIFFLISLCQEMKIFSSTSPGIPIISLRLSSKNSPRKN